MRYFPMFIKLAGRSAVVVGGGELAARKTRLLLKTEAQIVVAAPALDPELAHEAATGRIRHLQAPISADTFAGAALVFVATGCAGADAAVATLAKAAGALVNVVDKPELCDAVTPAIVDRDPVIVAIGTEGAAPVLARQIKSRVEAMLEPRLGDLAALAGRLRHAAKRFQPGARRALWRWAFSGAPRNAFRAGRERDAAAMIKDRILTGDANTVTERGFVSLVGAGPGAADLITLRGAQRLQEADVIFYDRLINPEILELARRDAERVFVGKAPGASAWPQDRINRVMAAAALQDKRVVRLKSGDPGIFARMGEEIAALDAAGVAWEITPGVTAASAAASIAGRSLTERGEIDSVIVTTGHVRDGDATPDWSADLRPGVAMVFYMAVANAGRIQAELLAGGHPPSLPVAIAQAIGGAGERVIETDLGRLAETIRAHDVANPAVIILSASKRSARARMPSALRPQIRTAQPA